MHSRNTIARIFFATLLLAPLAFTQTLTTGDLAGVVTDSTGAVVPGAVFVATQRRS